MPQKIFGNRGPFVLVAIFCWLLAEVAIAQQGPVAVMFSSDQKRDQALALSFLPLDLPPAKAAAFPLSVYLSAGDLERAFDNAQFRPDAAIVPTNTELLIASPDPATQRTLIDRVRKQPDVLRDLEDQIAARRKQSPATSGSEGGLLAIGVDTFVAQLPRAVNNKASGGAFPKMACLVATDYPKGGAIDRRELFAQDRVRKGIAGCLAALDAAGVQSVVLPLMGAASSSTQTNDKLFEGQRVLKECRLINSTAGIALGIHDFAPTRRSLREIGIVQWDREIVDMFSVPKGSSLAQSARNAYLKYAEQVREAVRKGLAGTKTTASDVDGSCNAIFNVQ
jgi:hypothetical protein